MAQTSKSMTDIELAALVESMRWNALGHQNDTLSIQRQQALDYYFGRPFGNEVDGRSQVVERTLMEAVEWTMPQILRSLMTADALAEFKPRGPEDVDQAEQETDYTNYVIMERNDGFIVIHDAVKDMLLLKNGYIKRYWETYDEPHIENYTGLDEIALTQLLTELEDAHDTVEVKGKRERQETIVGDPLSGRPDQTITVYDIELRVTDNRGRVCIKACPSEEILVSPRCRGSLQETDFVAHIPPMTRTDLISMGMDKDFVYSLPVKGQRRIKPEDRARDPLDQNAVNTYAPNNPAQEEVDFLEAYVRVDFDGDGVAELRKIVMAGGHIPPGKEWNQEVEEVPFSYGVITRMGHRHIGISLADFVEDIQLIRSTLIRQGLDNVYITNNQRPIVSNKVELGDVALSAPASPIRVDTDNPDVGGHIQYLEPAPILNQIMPVLDYFEDRKAQRTGIGSNNTIMDSEVLRDSANETIQTALTAANQRVEMYLRMISETLIRDLVRGVHGLLIRHQQEPEMVQLRGKWVNVNPREWKERKDLSITVGLGFGSADEKRRNLAFIGTVQQQAAAAGIVSPENAYNLASDMVKQAGFKAKDRYFTDPNSPDGQKLAQSRQQPPPNVQAAQITAQSRIQTAQINAQADTQKAQLDAQTAVTQHANDHMRKANMDAGTLNLEEWKILLDFVARIVSANELSKSKMPGSDVNEAIHTAEGDAMSIRHQSA